jgi:hypothetical protein
MQDCVRFCLKAFSPLARGPALRDPALRDNLQGKRLRDIALHIHKLYEFNITVRLQAFWSKHAENLAL